MDIQTDDQDRVERGWFSYKNAAVYTDMSEVSLWRLVRQGSLHPARINRSVRFSREELDTLLEESRRA
jgi:excisionase family DNA binding protein